MIEFFISHIGPKVEEAKLKVSFHFFIWKIEMVENIKSDEKELWEKVK